VKHICRERCALFLGASYELCVPYLATRLMKEIRIGYSKIYNAEGCNLLGRKEIILQFLVNGIEVRVFVGSEHKHLISVFSESGSNNKSVQIHPTPKIYPADLYTEILALQTLQVEDDIAEAFENRNEKAKEFIGSKAIELHPNLSIATDYIAGLIGLRLHNNLVRKLITEQSYEYCTLSDIYSFRSGFVMNFIPSIEWDISEGNRVIFPKLQEAWSLEEAAKILAWVLRAWDAEDPILRFVSLFIPLEIVVKKYNEINNGPSEIDIWGKQRKEILKIVQGASIDNKEAGWTVSST
jgi:hypothetical protein